MIKINRFSTLDKLTLLLTTFILGFIFSLYIGFSNMVKMKESIDLIYFGSYVQVVKLKNIKETLDEKVIKEVIQYNNKNVTSLITMENMLKFQDLIKKEWKYYRDSYKTKEELKNVEKTNTQIKNALNYLEKITLKMTAMNRIDLNEIVYNLENTIDSIEFLVKYETDHAYLQKQEINNTYTTTVKIMGIVVLVIFIGISIISYYIVISIKNNEDALVKMAKNLQELSITDPLTKLFNRRHFGNVFAKEAKRCQRDKKYLTFMMIDIDFFKKYNDTYGHGMGDDVLKSVANCFKNNLKRPSDFVFRLGGEEFGILVSGESPENVRHLADYVVEKVRDLKIPHKASEVSEFLSISLGYLSFIPTSETHIDKVMEDADEFLYKTKESGRNGANGIID